MLASPLGFEPRIPGIPLIKHITSLHYAKHSQQAISKASKWGHLGICDDSPERCWIHKSSKRLVMLSIAPKTNSTVALDPPHLLLQIHAATTYITTFSTTRFSFSFEFFSCRTSVKPRPKTIQASYSHPDSLSSRA